jgi:predicted CoA-binding protein
LQRIEAVSAGGALIIEDRHGLVYAVLVHQHTSKAMHQNPTDEEIREVLRSVRRIAVVGASDKASRPAHGVMRFLQEHGYRTIPVNPRLAGQTLLGEPVYATLTDIPDAIDMVDIFMNSARVEPIVENALDTDARVIWMQLGVINPAAALKAQDAGLTVIMDRCPAIEWRRLGLEAGERR